MIINCEKCGTRFKVADEKISADGVKVRCSKCAHIFTVTKDSAEAAAPPEAAGPTDPFRAPLGSDQSTAVRPMFPDGAPSSDPFAAKPTVPASPSASGSAAASQDPFSSRPSGPGPGASAPGADDGGGPTDPFAPRPTAKMGSLPSGEPQGSEDDGAPASGGAPPLPKQPPPTPAADPFAAPAAGGADPFAAKPAGASDPFGGGGGGGGAGAPPDPFGAGEAPQQVASPAGADPFAAPAAGGADPFGGDEDNRPKSSAPVEDDPFDPGQADPFAAAAPESGSSDPFAALGLEDAGGYEPDFDAPDAVAPTPPPGTDQPPPDEKGAFGYQAETRVHEVDEELRKKSAGDDGPSKPSRGGLRLPGQVGAVIVRAAWVLVQATLLAGFLTLAIVYARGGNVDDVLEGRATDVVLGRVTTAGDATAPLRAEEVAVARRPAGAGGAVVVVSGFVANDGDADAPAVRVTAAFGDKSFTGWAGTEMSGLDLADLDGPEALERLMKRTPEDATVKVGARRRFYVLARAVEDGQKAAVSVEVAEPPPPPPPPPAPVDEAEEGEDAVEEVEAAPSKRPAKRAAARKRVQDREAAQAKAKERVRKRRKKAPAARDPSDDR